MSLTTLIPAPYRIAILGVLCAALVAFGWLKGAQHVQAKWDAAEGARTKAVAAAYSARIESNRQLAARQAAINADIQKGKEDEIAHLTARLAAAGRLRVGTAVCGGPATANETAGPAGGDGADSPGRLVREDVDRDLKALILAVETDLATGRACQAFVSKHDLSP